MRRQRFPHPGDDDGGYQICDECGTIVPVDEIYMHDGTCKVCYDDNHFGEEDEDDDDAETE